MSFSIKDPWSSESALFASEVTELEFPPTHYQVLGPNGKPLPRPTRERIGFVLREPARKEHP